MSDRKRYAHVGLGSRSKMYIKAITGDFKEHCEYVALCDTNQGRMDRGNRLISEAGSEPVATYQAADFDRMVAETKPDTVIVTTMDVTHSDYICRAMELGCDVITEKPMTTDEQRCQQILNTAKSTGQNVVVTFNYRYSPAREQLKEIISSGEIGEVLSVDFAWLLNTKHGADYFRRWHGERKNSGSLLVHKATHHFDLVNWWIDDVPEEVFCHGSLKFYTPETADKRGLTNRAERCLNCPEKDKCRFYMDLSDKDDLRELYLENEEEDGYFRDRCVFGERIDIWDNMSVSVRYQRGALLNYFLHSYAPYEGYRIAFNGTKGRLEHVCGESTYISGDGTVPGAFQKGKTATTLIPEFSEPQNVEVRSGTGGHGGGDVRLLTDLFCPNLGPDPTGLRAGRKDGAYSILIGTAAYHSIDTGKAVKIADLLGDAPLE